jgi:opacity protein-like surface antigen
MNGASRLSSLFTPTLAFFALGVGPAAAADLAAQQPQVVEPAAILSGWEFTLTPYLWAPWFSGNATIKGHNFNVEADPADVFGALKFAVMGDLEARKGPFSLMVDGFYGNLGGSSSFLHTGDIPAGAALSANAALTIVEVGGSYEVMRSGSAGLKDATGSYTALDLVAGARIWQQSLDANLNLVGPLGGRLSLAHSGQVDWTDPFVGARLRYQFAPGQDFALRGDIGGFDAGSIFSWQALATYNRHLFDFKGYPVDAYLGFRALSVDYTQGSGPTKYTYDVVQYGPVAGVTVHFGDLSASAAEPAGVGGYKDGPMSAPAVSWTGYYLGVDGGGGWGDSNTLIFTDAVQGVGNPGSFDRKGGFGGIEAGYNRQGGFGLGESWVLGLETDFQGSEINNSFSRIAPFLVAGSTFFDAKQGIDYFGTVRGRIGYAIGSALIYGTGGFAYGNVITKIRLANFGFTNSLRDVGTETGYAVGGGVEYVFAPGWSAKLEYQYVDLGDQSLSSVASDLTTDRTKVDNSFNTLRVGLNYHLQNDYVPLK